MRGKGGGRPTKFNRHKYKKMKYMFSEGYTVNEVAEAIEVTQSTIYEWAKKRPEFFKDLQNWKAEADKRVERSLYQKACGFEYEEEEAKVVALGNNQGSEIVKVKVKRKLPPEATSAIFWLKNRKPQEWRDKTETETKIVFEVPQITNEDERVVLERFNRALTQG